MEYKTVEELEKKFNFPKIKAKKFNINPQKLPKNLLFLIPFIDYYVSKDELTRKRFYKEAPLAALTFLEKTMSDVDNLLNDYFSEYKQTTLSGEYLSLCLLREMAEEYSSYRDDVDIISNRTQKEIDDFFDEVDKW